MDTLTVATYNMHKGMSALNRKMQLEQMADAFKMLSPDVLFLQEVQGHNRKREQRIPDFPKVPHSQMLGDALNLYSSYGKNAQYRKRDHGNAILSNLPVETKNNLDITVNRMEQRGILHCEIKPENWDLPLVLLCAHLNLREPDREKQYQAIRHYILTQIDPDSPLILAGDFNDWRKMSCAGLGAGLRMQEVFLQNGNLPKTFPSRLPMLSLDRMYTRHLEVVSVMPLKGQPWQSLSDHLPLAATVAPAPAILKKRNDKTVG